ncbi:hypothetical protein J2Z48_001622 [Croceifilum oryzae]|uniref:Uncharacterized protein n=1 Tax=Croceifilum oryzae TaxID=1553429 RepID=A0AAJ1TFB6_9BACL|nr:hypothetical protein [Croceifilum oryzae]MDQ0417449.1 hypothetical protein [Croceifilum oryzae]
MSNNKFDLDLQLSSIDTGNKGPLVTQQRTCGSDCGASGRCARTNDCSSDCPPPTPPTQGFGCTMFFCGGAGKTAKVC